MITLEHVTKKYGNRTALQDVSIQIGRGRTAGILGRNGAGKTTALNLMTGYFPPDSGRVLIDGTDMMLHPGECKRKIGYLPEKPPLYDEMTVYDYLSFVSDLREVKAGERKRHVTEIMEICFLKETGGRVIGNLSKGYRQRVGIAQALCGNPEILILDEPTAGLDPMQTVEIRQLIRELGKEHTILFSSHILSEVQQLCTHAVILHEGKLIRSFDLRSGGNEETAGTGAKIQYRLSAAGKEEEILSAVRSIACVQKAEALHRREAGTAEILITGYRGDERGPLTDQLFHLLAAMDAPIRQLVQEKDDLETIFLQATADR